MDGTGDIEGSTRGPRGPKKDKYAIISDIDHLLLLLTVAFAETIPLLSVSMSSRSSIVLPSLGWLLPKELSLHALSRGIKLDQFSRPFATSHPLNLIEK